MATVTNLTAQQVYDLLESLREVDYAGTKTSAEAVDLRKKLTHEFLITEKEITKICRYASQFYKKNGSSIGSKTRSGLTVVEAVKEFENENLNIAVGGYVFYENLEAKRLVPFRNLVKYTKTQREEIFKGI